MSPSVICDVHLQLPNIVEFDIDTRVQCLSAHDWLSFVLR